MTIHMRCGSAYLRLTVKSDSPDNSSTEADLAGVTMRLSVECVYGAYLKQECVRVIAMDDDASLYDLHYAIQDAVGFDDDHPFGFYTANSSRTFAHKHWLFGDLPWPRQEAAFSRTRIRDLWPLGRRKLYYLFDFGDLWTFEVRKMRVRGSDPPGSGPLVLERRGPDPEQYPSQAGDTP